MTKNNLEARIAGWLVTESNKPKTKHHKPGSQKK